MVLGEASGLGEVVGLWFWARPAGAAFSGREGPLPQENFLIRAPTWMTVCVSLFLCTGVRIFSPVARIC